MNENPNQPDDAEELSPEVRKGIEEALEAAGELTPEGSSTSWALGAAVTELFNDTWRIVVESAPDGARPVDIRREADRIAHESIALAVAFLTMHDGEIEDYIDALDEGDRLAVESHARWLAEYLQRQR